MKVKEIKIDRKEFNLIVNDILLDVKPIKLRIKIANRLLEHFDNKQEQIQNLEAKLAEKQSKIQELNDMYEDLLCAKGTENELMQVSADCDFFAKENRKLKQQLVEKDKEIDKLYEENEDWSNANQVLQIKLKNKDQDKISFAVEQLEKVREIALKDFDLDKCNLSLARVLDKIDNQIKQLKEKV